MKKNILILSLLLPTLFVVSCNKNNDSKEEIASSSLIGTFVRSDLISAQIVHKFGQDDKLYANFWALSSLPDPTAVNYGIEQHLKLSRNYTYINDVTITLTNPGDWGAEFARIHYEVSGTYTYLQLSEDKYKVELANPTSGTENIYSFTINNSGSLYGLNIHSDVDYSINIEEALLNPLYVLDDYVRGNVVYCIKSSDASQDNKVESKLFFNYILDTFAMYCTY